MRRYTVYRHWQNAYQALRRFQKHIAIAETEAAVNGHPSHAGLRRCREFGGCLHEWMLDLRRVIQDHKGVKRQKASPKAAHLRWLRQKAAHLRWLRQKAAIEDKSFISVGGLVASLIKQERQKRAKAKKKA